AETTDATDASTGSTGTSDESSGTETGDECVVGTESCPCDEDDVCDDGLTCISDFCVDYVPVCGDGVLHDGEQCDNGALNADDGICRSDCMIQKCGDSFVGPGEACDDGNTNDADDCNNSCALPTCGNGVVEGDEECDDGDED